MQVPPPGGNTGSPPPKPKGGGGGGNIGGGSGIPGFAGWEVQQTPNGPVFIGAVTNTGQLIRPGQPIPGRPGFYLSVPPQYANLPTGNPAPSGGGGSPPPSGTPGGTGGTHPFVPPGGVSANIGTAAGLPASQGLLGVLQQMFPFVTDFGNALPGQGGTSGGSLLSTASAIEDAAQVFGQIGALMGQFLRGIELLFTPTFWVRVLLFLLGLPGLVYGLIQLGRHHSGSGVAIGIMATGASLILMFGAFHNLPTSVTSPGTFAQWLHDSLTGQATLTAATAPVNSLMEGPLTAPSASGSTAGP